jgi:integrase-like protein
MSQANLTWGSPPIVGALRKLGIDVPKSTVETYRMRHCKPPSPMWKTFLKHHIPELVALDFCTVPAVTCRVLFALVILAHERRRVLQVNVTEHPTAEWTARQAVEAFPWDEAPRDRLRDHDRVYGTSFPRGVYDMGIEAVVIAPWCPWQNPYVERFIGGIRGACLDDVIVLSKRHLKRLLQPYLEDDRRWRTHLSVAMNCPVLRPLHPPEQGTVIAVPEVRGLHHHDEQERERWHEQGNRGGEHESLAGTHTPSEPIVEAFRDEQSQGRHRRQGILRQTRARCRKKDQQRAGPEPQEKGVLRLRGGLLLAPEESRGKDQSGVVYPGSGCC